MHTRTGAARQIPVPTREREQKPGEQGEEQADRRLAVSCELALLLGLALMALCVVLIAKSDLGMPIIALFSYVLSRIVPSLSFGTWNYIVQCSMIVLLAAALRRVRPGYALSFVLAILFGLLIDLFSFLLAGLPVTLGLRALYFALGFGGQVLSSAILLRCRLPILPYDTFTRDLAAHCGIRYRFVRTGFDIGFLSLSAVLGYFVLGGFVGIGVGTVLTGFCLGTAVGFVAAKLDHRLVFRPSLPVTAVLLD